MSEMGTGGRRPGKQTGPRNWHGANEAGCDNDDVDEFLGCRDTHKSQEG